MSVTPAKMRLNAGLSLDKSRAFAGVIQAITGKDLGDALPYLAPALLFSDDAAQAAMGVPQPAADEVLLHDYQALRHISALPLDSPLDATLSQNGGDYGIRLAHDGVEVLTMDTALRRVARADVLGLTPTCFKQPERLATLGLHSDLTISQAQVETYLDLSGDRNPIHHDPAEAALLGLAAPIVPGLLLAATVQPACHAAFPTATLQSLRARFMAPLCVGAPYQIALQDRKATPDGHRLRAYVMSAQAHALAVIDLLLSPA